MRCIKSLALPLLSLNSLVLLNPRILDRMGVQISEELSTSMRSYFNLVLNAVTFQSSQGFWYT